MKIRLIMYKIIMVISIVVMLWAVETTIIIPKLTAIFSVFRAKHSIKIIILINIFSLIVACLTLFFIKYFFINQYAKRRDITNRKTYIILTIELILYFIALLVFFKFIGFVHPVDDTRITLNFMDKLVKVGHFDYDYMYSNPQNLFLMYLFKGIQYFFGRSYFPILIFFCLIHIGTILFSFFSIKNLRVNNYIALITIQLWILSVQISMHAGIAYTDILALFFTSVSLFFSLALF